MESASDAFGGEGFSVTHEVAQNAWLREVGSHPILSRWLQGSTWHDGCVPLAAVAGLLFCGSLESYAVGRAAGSRFRALLVVLACSKILGNTQP